VARRKELGLPERGNPDLEAEEGDELQDARELALDGLESRLPGKYRGYMTEVPRATPGNKAARELLRLLGPGRSVHLWGKPGNTKSHLAIHAAVGLIERYGLRVKFLDRLAIEELADIKKVPPRFTDEDVILVDDIDKVLTHDLPSRVVQTLLRRPDLGKTTIFTAQRPLAEVVAKYEPDVRNREALISRLYCVKEAEVKGPDFRLVEAAKVWSG